MKKLVVSAIMVVFLFGTLAYAAAPATVKADEVKKVDKAKKNTTDPLVYVKEKGKKYHKKSCKTVKEKKGIKLSEALKNGYTPCAVCNPASEKTKPAETKKNDKMKEVK